MKKIVINDLVENKMMNLDITKRQATFTIRGPTSKKERDGIFEVRKKIDDKNILIRYTIQGKEIKVAAVELF